VSKVEQSCLVATMPATKKRKIEPQLGGALGGAAAVDAHYACNDEEDLDAENALVKMWKCSISYKAKSGLDPPTAVQAEALCARVRLRRAEEAEAAEAGVAAACAEEAGAGAGAAACGAGGDAGPAEKAADVQRRSVAAKAKRVQRDAAKAAQAAADGGGAGSTKARKEAAKVAALSAIVQQLAEDGVAGMGVAELVGGTNWVLASQVSKLVAPGTFTPGEIGRAITALTHKSGPLEADGTGVKAKRVRISALRAPLPLTEEQRQALAPAKRTAVDVASATAARVINFVVAHVEEMKGKAAELQLPEPSLFGASVAVSMRDSASACVSAGFFSEAHAMAARMQGFRLCEPRVVAGASVEAERVRIREQLHEGDSSAKVVSIRNIGVWLFLLIAAGIKEWEFRGGDWEGVGETSPRTLLPGDIVVFRCAELGQSVFCEIGEVARSDSAVAVDACMQCEQVEQRRASAAVEVEIEKR
jgi:hypothetical protein